MNAVQVTIISYNAPISKHVTLVDNKIVKTQPKFPPSKGFVKIHSVSSLVEFGDLLKSLQPHQATVCGLPPDGAINVVTKSTKTRMVSEGTYTSDYCTRTNSDFTFGHGTGILRIDYDPLEAPLSRDALYAALHRAAPCLEALGSLWMPSAGSCISETSGDVITGVKGQSIYYIIDNASQMQDIGDALVTRLWAEGYGKFIAGSIGQRLERLLIDASIWQPSRLDYTGPGALCGAGLVQKRDAIIRPGTGLLTFDAIKPTATIIARSKRNRDSARAKITPDCHRLRQILDKDVYGEDCDSEFQHSVSEWRDRVFDHHVLDGEWIIFVEDCHGEFVGTTVKEILKNRKAYDGGLCYDPVEGQEPNSNGYYQRQVAKLFLSDIHNPTLWTQAHGGASYRLETKKSLRCAVGEQTNAVNGLLGIMRDSSVFYSPGWPSETPSIVTMENGDALSLSVITLPAYLDSLVDAYKITFESGVEDEQKIDIPVPVMLACLHASNHYRGLPILDGVSSLPVLCPNYTIHDKHGYDAVSRYYYTGEPKNIALKPTKKQALDALQTLWKPFRCYKFASTLDRSVMFAALLTAVSRNILPLSPGFLFDAPTQGSGKSMLATCIGYLATGGKISMMSAPTKKNGAEEFSKRVDAALLAQGRVIALDNLTGTVECDALAVALTSEEMNIRALGSSDLVKVPNKKLILMTANNASFDKDLHRRILVCRIDTGVENPESLIFDFDPVVECSEQYVDMVSAAITLLRFWVSSDEFATYAPQGSFREWDRLVNGAIKHISNTVAPGEYEDVQVVFKMNSGRSQEAEYETDLLRELHSATGGNVFMTKSIISKMSSASRPELRDALTNVGIVGTQNRPLSAVAISRALSSRIGKIHNGLRAIECNVDRTGAKRFQIIDDNDATNVVDVRKAENIVVDIQTGKPQFKF